jgi:uncharacterized protein YdcH (DUF465 family)
VRGYSSRIEQVEDRISELEDNIENAGTWESWTLKEKRCKPKGYIIYSIK